MAEPAPPPLTAAELFKEHPGPYPTLLEALSQEEVANPQTLPFAVPSAEAAVAALQQEFKKTVAGLYNEECGRFLDTNNIGINPTAQLMYLVARVAKGQSQSGA